MRSFQSVAVSIAFSALMAGTVALLAPLAAMAALAVPAFL